MKCTLSEIRTKEIINVSTGKRIGYIDDLVFETKDGSVKSFIIYGRSKFFGLLGKEDDLTVNVGDVELIGEDTILIRQFDNSAIYSNPVSLNKPQYEYCYK